MSETPQRTESDYRRQSYWLDSVPGSLAPRPALEGNLQADIVIIGAGYTGLWSAYYLKHHAPDLDIAVLEADIAGFGASGRNGGWCTSYLSCLDRWLEDPETGEFREAVLDISGQGSSGCTSAARISRPRTSDGAAVVNQRSASSACTCPQAPAGVSWRPGTSRSARHSA